VSAPSADFFWTTTLDELMAIFRDGLIALVPIAERARIAWHDAEAYDDWDRIAEAVFQSVVVDAIENSNAGPLQRPLAKYGFVGQPHAAMSVIQVAHASMGVSSDLAFIDFGSNDTPFDTVRAERMLDGSSDLITLPFGEARFLLKPWVPGGHGPTQAELSVKS
jgi:hypothetical protein